MYKVFDGNIKIEHVWAEKVGNYYKIVNVPFLQATLHMEI